MIQVSIRAGESLSDPVNISGMEIHGVVIGCDGWTTAQVTMDALIGDRWYPVYNNEFEEFRVWAQPHFATYWTIRIVADEIRVRSGTSQYPVVQAADRTVILLTR